jgi:hypothetical protein
VIKKMQEKYVECKGMACKNETHIINSFPDHLPSGFTMDARELKFPDESFDLVLDKGKNKIDLESHLIFIWCRHN